MKARAATRHQRAPDLAYPFRAFLVEAGHVKETKDAFKRFLTPGKPGYVPHAWATLTDAVSWIHAAGGQAVVAHPGRYKVTATRKRRLLSRAFCEAGGDGIEVLSSSHTHAQFAEYATYARAFGLLAGPTVPTITVPAKAGSTSAIFRNCRSA